MLWLFSGWKLASFWATFSNFGMSLLQKDKFRDVGACFLLSPSALTPGKDILTWMDHSAHRQHSSDDELCQAPEGSLAGGLWGTEVPGWT